MQGKKTHEQQRRILERKSDVPDARRTAENGGRSREPCRTGHYGAQGQSGRTAE